jgi:hypothetical protein
MHPFIIVAAILSTLGAHCPPPPAPVPESRVYFDSGAVVRVHLEDGADVRGTLVNRLAPGGTVLMLCAAQHEGECDSPESTTVREVPLSTVTQLRYRSNAAGLGAVAGFRLGMLGGFMIDEESPLFLVTGVAAGAVGWLLGSPITTWPTLAKRDESGRLLWSPGVQLIPSPRFGEDFVVGCARGDSLPRPDLVAVARRTRQPFYVDVRRAWLVDMSAGRLVPVSTAGMRCANRTWLELASKDALRAPPESVHASLRFTASPGRSRLYLYHVTAWIMDPFVLTLDHEVIGELAHDRYMTLELAPGQHRLGALRTRDSVMIETAADSVYFLKVMPGSWKITGTLFTTELLDPAEGRKLIRGAALMPSTAP